MRGSSPFRRAAGSGSHDAPETAGMSRWLLTYADMITLLLALFIILFSISTINKAKYNVLAHELSSGFNAAEPANLRVAANAGRASGPPIQDDLLKVKRQLDSFIARHRLGDKVRTRLDRKGLIITLLTDKALYDSGSADLRPQTRAVLDEIAGVLRRNSNAIRVEGNTDDVPISTDRYPSNWELSAARATNVVRYLIANERLAPTRVSLAGYGEFHPMHANSNETMRQLNRRVDIVILSGALTRIELGENVQ